MSTVGTEYRLKTVAEEKVNPRLVFNILFSSGKDKSSKPREMHKYKYIKN